MFRLTLFLICCSIFFSNRGMAQTDLNIPIKGICIYIDYPDAPADISASQLDEMLNDMDYQDMDINRSFRKYWHQETRRNYDVQHDVFFYRAPNPAGFYAAQEWFEGIELWKKALEWIIAENPDYDWNQLSKWSANDPFDKERPDFFEGALKSVIVISSIWGPAGVGAAHFPGWRLSNGEIVGTVGGSVLQAPWHATRNLFVLFHESGHALFNFPDTYDYDASSGGTAKYSLMSAQGPDVEPIGAPFVYQHNWGYIKQPGPGTYTYTLPADGDTIVVLKNLHDPNEFFALEVRKKSTLGNSLFPVPIGLLVWHSDRKVHTHNTLEAGTRYAHYKHSIVQKDGLRELENGGPVPPINSGDIYLNGDILNDDSNPAARWWSGEASGIEIKDIEILDDEHLKFTVVIGEPPADHYDFIPKDEWNLVSQTPSAFGHGGEKAFDNDVSTYYHVPWGSTEPRPHELVVDLGQEYSLNVFYYTANDNFSPPWEGRIRDYELSLSIDGLDWGNPIVMEQYFQTPYRQYALFPETNARYARLSALNSYGDDVRTSVAEIDFRGRELVNTSTLLKSDFSIQIVPNPLADFIEISNLSQGMQVSIYDALGHELDDIPFRSNNLKIITSSYPNGVIFINISDETGQVIYSTELVKMRP